MGTIGLPGPSISDADPDIERVLEEIDWYIQLLARKALPVSGSMFTHVDFDVDDLTQVSRIKLWQALQKKDIDNPRAYLRRIVHNEVVNILRQLREHVSLRTDIDGELSADFMVETFCEELDSPEHIVEQEEAVAELLSDITSAIARLHARQRHVAFCTARDRVDDLDQFLDACEAHGLDTGYEWPDDEKERHLLQASFGAARSNIARHMDLDMAAYRGKRR
ncbi:MAG TPA: sigma-70 family RNA polymerase sigma factor [Ktedonobacteraceae bacterium]|jgi:RNA polymerase sigma factor (sigma-70 family)|nr:sigma-70 family RNA polymerase sigma factor [Ktedonobacteraceae bacterium]